MHVDEREEVALAAQQRRRRKTKCVGGSWFVVVTRSVAAARIYREDLPRVTSSHNRLAISLYKRIRHRLVAKITDKRRLRGFGPDFGGLLTHTSCACTHRHAWRGEASEYVCFSLSPLFHILVSV
jgi:hypothetical protein